MWRKLWQRCRCAINSGSIQDRFWTARWCPAGKSADNGGMALLIGGLALFIVAHLVPTRPAVRAGLVDRLGPGLYRMLFSLVSIAGLALIVFGYGHMQGLGRGNPQLWVPPAW